MNNGPFLFLGSFVALLLSWLGLVVAPQVQLRDLQPVKNDTTGKYYPLQRLGLARQGAEVYRANACYTCHSQQVRQEGYHFRAVIEKVGTNETELVAALHKFNPRWRDYELDVIAQGEGAVIDDFSAITLQQKASLEARFDSTKVSEYGAKLRFDFIPTGADIEVRKWGVRASVAADYLYDDPLMLGSQRIGPDLSNVGNRWPEAGWQLHHLYHPRTKVEGSTMPDYRFLFEKRRIGAAPSPAALQLTGDLAPPDGWEIIPTADALALVAYLQSLKVTEALFEAPTTIAP